MPNLNTFQIMAITLVVLSALSGASAQLADAGLTAGTVKMVVGLSGLAATTLSGILAFLSGQGSLVRAVQAMPGIEKITVNGAANSTLAQIAVGPSDLKVEAAPGAVAAVVAAAKS